MSTSQKNKVLLVTGIADTFFSSQSKRQLPYGVDLADKVQALVTANGDAYKAVVNLKVSGDTNRHIKPLASLRPQKVVDLQLNGNKLFDVSNEITLTTEDGDLKLMNGNDLDFIFRPEEYEFHILGVDINGVYKDFINELITLGYNVFLYSDLIKRFRETEASIKTIRSRQFKYCSSKAALDAKPY